LAMACFMLAAVETAAIGRTFALKHGYRLDANQEFLGLAAANLSVGFFHGYPVSGGMSQSLVNESAGARTPLSGFFAACIVLLVLRRASRPQTTELGRVPGTDYFADALRHEENVRSPDTFIFRTNASLLYFNVEHVRDRFMELLNKRGEGTKVAVFFMGTVPM